MFGGGSIGLFRASGQASTNLEWDDFKAGFDTNANGTVDDSGDRLYANYDFSSAVLTFAHDDNGNLTNSGLFQYQYDAWNRLIGVYYAAGNATVSTEAVAQYDNDARAAV